jgi:PAS domain S-box-containing protein
VAAAPAALLALGFGLAAALALPDLAGAQRVPDFNPEWRWVDFGAESGLPAGVPRAVVERDSVVWTYTDEAAAWYDGFQWHRAVWEGEAMSGRVTSLAPDSAGGLLLVQAGRLFRGGAEGFALVDLPSDMEGATIRAAVPFEAGRLLVTTSDPRPSLWVVEEGGAREVSDIALTDAAGLRVTGAGHAWLSTTTGFTMWLAGRWIPRDPVPPTPAPSGAFVMEGANGEGLAWRVDGGGVRRLFRFEGNGAFVPQTTEGDNILATASVGPRGLMLAVYESGDVRAWNGDEWSTVLLPPSRRHGIRLVHIGTNGDFWFGTAGGLHLFRSARNRFTVQRSAFPSPNNRVNAVLVAADETMWMGTGGGILRHQPGNTEWIREAAGVSLESVTGLAEDSRGRVWASSGSGFQGVVRYADGVWNRLGPAEGVDPGFVHRVFAEADGTVWLASLGRPDGGGAGLYRWTDTEGLEAVFPALGIADARVYSVARAPNGALWVATADGAYRLDPDGGHAFIAVGTSGSPGASALWDVTLDPDGTPWFLFNPDLSRGLLRLVGDSLVEVRPPYGGGARRMWSAAFDQDGTLWVGSEAGILSLRDGTWSVFDENMGLPSVNVWPLVIIPTNLLAGTKGGGLIILSRAESGNPAPRVLLGARTLDGGSLRLAFTALPYWGEQPAQRVEVRTRTDGGPWSEWSLSRDLLVPRLSPGVHEVEVQAKGMFGQLSRPVLARVDVPFPLPLRPVFAVPVGLLIGALLATGGLAARRRIRDREALRLSEGRLRALVEGSAEAIGLLDLSLGRFVDANSNVLLLTGLGRAEFLKTDLLSLTPPVLPDGRNASEALRDLTTQAGEGEAQLADWVVRGAQGAEIPCSLHLSHLPSATGALLRVGLKDVRRRQAFEEERRALEDQLRQSQKLEAVGQLTGGVAHDFNNLLTVIHGNLELLAETATLDSEDSSLLAEAVQAAERSARLTQRLLAFSRRQTLDPSAVDLSALADALRDLLTRSLGEAIQITFSVPQESWPVTVDEGQLEGAILNLCLNSRDAMPLGGRIRIQAVNVPREEVAALHVAGLEARDYVRLSVSDTGTGMPPEVQARAFDPFFTTKEVGKGTGLGLSMVYGFVTQSGGAVVIDSEPGAGTTVALYLPRDLDLAARGDPSAESGVPHGAGETILLVEDDPGVTRLLVQLFARLGYEGVAVEDGEAAMALVETGAHFDVLLTDLVLPGGMAGVDVARFVARKRPSVPILYMSGYAEEALPEAARPPSGGDVLRKPFDLPTLALKLRRALDER